MRSSASRLVRLAGAVLLTVAFFVIMPRSARAQTDVAIHGDEVAIAIGVQMEILRDGSGELAAQAVAAAAPGRFVLSESKHPNFGFTRDAVWARFSLSNVTERTLDLVFDATREWVDEVDLFQVSEGNVKRVGASGSRVPLALRPIPTERIAFPVQLGARETRSLLLRVRSRSPVALRAEVSTRAAFSDEISRTELLFGAYYAVLLGLAAYSGILFLVLRDRQQALVGALLAGQAIAEATAHGHVSRLLPAAAGWLEQSGGALGFMFWDLALLLLAQSIVPAGLHPSLQTALRRATWVIGSTALVPVLVPAAFPVMFAAMLGAAVMTSVAAIPGVRAGSRTAIYFSLAIGVQVLPGCVTLATLMGVFPAYPATEYGNHVGGVAMSCLLSLLVADTIRQGRERVAALGLDSEALNRRLKNQLEELDVRTHEVEGLNEELRHQVAERSRELTEVLSRAEVAVAPTIPDVGGLFESRYRIMRALGRGGMGAVYEVERARDGRRLALKIVTGELSGRAAARFAREAEIGARLTHDNLVSIVDVGIAAGGTPFLVMELVSGGSLEEQRPRFGHPGWAAPILTQVACGLTKLHEHGVVHRDLKPGNVLLAEAKGGASVAKICDFGISRFGALEDSNDVDVQGVTLKSPRDVSPRDLTQTGMLMGTPLYMPPEALFEPARRASADVFSFGILAYEMLSGRTPFSVPPVLLVRSRQSVPRPVPIEGIRTELSTVILSCLDVHASARPRARELVSSLQQGC